MEIINKVTLTEKERGGEFVFFFAGKSMKCLAPSGKEFYVTEVNESGRVDFCAIDSSKCASLHFKEQNLSLLIAFRAAQKKSAQLAIFGSSDIHKKEAKKNGNIGCGFYCGASYCAYLYSKN